MSVPGSDGASAGAGAVERAARVVLRPIGNPLPLGFLALAGGTLLVSGLQLGWLQEEEGREVALLLIAVVAPLQLVASVLGFLARDVVAATATLVRRRRRRGRVASSCPQGS